MGIVRFIVHQLHCQPGFFLFVFLSKFKRLLWCRYIVTMSAPAPPAEKDLQAKAETLKKAETKEGGGGVDPAVVAVYKKAFADGGGDKDKVCAALGLDSSKWAAGGEA